MKFEELVLSLGPTIAGPIYTAWRRRRGKTDENTTSLRELIARDTQNELAANKIEREISGLAESVVESLQPIFSADSLNLSKNARNAVTAALVDTFNVGGLSPKFLFERQLDPLIIANHYKELGNRFCRGFSEQELLYYDACLKEISRRFVAIADDLPGATSDFFSEVLKNHDRLYKIGKQTLDKITEFTERHRKKKTYLIDNFLLTYK